MIQKLFGQTLVYGISAVLPRMLTFLLVILHTTYLDSPIIYGRLTVVFSWMMLLNVILTYGMETAFFRFLNDSKYKKNSVKTTASISLIVSSILFYLIIILYQNYIAKQLEIQVEFLHYLAIILVLDTLTVIPFANLRAEGKSIKFALLKTLNVIIYSSFNILFLIILPKFYSKFELLDKIYIENFQLDYILIANIIASGFVLMGLSSFYFKITRGFDIQLLKKMLKYGHPVMLAGIAFSINEHFDKILVQKLALEGEKVAGAYGACYKLALFMTLFATAFRLGIEPFFFSKAKDKDAKETYCAITKLFTLLGCCILVVITTLLPFLKEIMIRDHAYWFAVDCIPVILIANLLLGIYHTISVWYKITDQTIYAAYISIGAAIITIVTNYILIPKHSYWGSAIATILAYGIMLISSGILGSQKYPINYNWTKITLYLLSSSSCSAIIYYSLNSNYYYTIPIAFLFILTLLWLEKKFIQQIIKP